MKALVSGAHGFIGSHLTEALLARGHKVRALVSPWGKTANLAAVQGHPGLELVRGDITDPDSLRGVGDGVEVVFHTAARVADWGAWQAFYRTNVEGTEHLLRESERGGAHRFVLVSSVAVHRYAGFREADPRTQPRDGGDTNAYARSKSVAEDRVMQASGVEPVVVRPGLWPFGPRDTNFLRIARALKAGTLPLVNGGRSVINTAYAGNLVEGILLAGETPAAAGKAYVIADEGMPSWKEVFTVIAEQLGGPPPRLRLPGSTAQALAALVETSWTRFLPDREPPLTSYRAGLMLHDVHFSIRAAQEELGYQPRWSWQEGVRLTLEQSGLAHESRQHL